MTMLLSAADLASMRATLNRTLPDTATIQRDTLGSDGSGGQTVSSTATTGPFACRVAATASTTQRGEQVIAGKLDAVGVWTITLPAGTDVKATDRILIGSRTFDVTLPLRPRSWQLSCRVLCTETI